MRDEILGDLLEEFRYRYDPRAPAAALRWYWSQSLRSAARLGWFRLGRSSLARTVVGAALGFVALMLWLPLLNQAPILDAVRRLPPSILEIATLLLELSGFLIGGFVLGRFARGNRVASGLLFAAVALGWPVLYQLSSTGSIEHLPATWWTLAVVAGVQLGAWVGTIGLRPS